jgi:hypothetical protein
VIWATLQENGVAEWVDRRRGASPAPRIYRTEEPEATRARLAAIVAPSGWSALNFDFVSGALTFELPRIPELGIETRLELLRGVAAAIDPGRTVFRWDDLDEEERGALGENRRAVAAEEFTQLEGMNVIGPGGRLVLYEGERTSTAVVSVRGRTTGVPSEWRDAPSIAAIVEEAVDDSPRAGLRIRGAFGYYEASRYDRQEWLRPAFIFVLDQPKASEGPRWRVAFTVPATHSDEVPPGAGVGHASGGCV